MKLLLKALFHSASLTMITSIEHSTRTDHGIKSDAVRYIWAGYFVFVLLSSLIGDTIILIASIKYRAFKLHKVIVVIIQHIAVCDLLVSVSFIAPRTISLLANARVIGDVLCYLSPYLAYYLNAVAVLLICIMTSYKLYILKHSLRTSSLTSSRAHSICAAVWFFSGTVPLLFFIVDKNDVSFDFRSYVCDYHMTSEHWSWLKPIMTIVLISVPIVVVVNNTARLLVIAVKVARRGGGCLKWQGIMTTILTGAVYCVSMLPYAIYRLGERHFVSESNRNFFHSHFFRIAQSFVILNTISNFYIYCLTLSSFREFLCGFSRLQKIHSSQGNKVILLKR